MLYAQVVGVQEGKVKLQNKKNTDDSAIFHCYCHFGFLILQCGSPVWHFYAQASTWGGHISNTYQNRGSQHHGKNTQDSHKIMVHTGYLLPNSQTLPYCKTIFPDQVTAQLASSTILSSIENKISCLLTCFVIWPPFFSPFKPIFCGLYVELYHEI